ncbi:unnamed protein product [Cyclocybe aegerita]|uniref:Uncharacterized protein n=1 Tax=Cyclocybe aegerita TaxID=1973307 RepID=A0A8S0X868_CYCAE|nr:unnamed protein product [Cyclocybe aegerita]
MAGCKGGGKKKKFQSLGEVLDRISVLVQTTPVARKAVFEAGAIPFPSEALHKSSREAKEQALKILHGFATGGVEYQDTLTHILPYLVNLSDAEEMLVYPTIELI